MITVQYSLAGIERMFSMTITVISKDGLQVSIGPEQDARVKAVLPGSAPKEFLVKLKRADQVDGMLSELKAWGLRVVLARKLRGVIVYTD